MKDVRRLSAGRWFIPLLALMSAEQGARFGVLVRRLGVSPSVLSRHVAVLEEQGWLARNPGHGHPLRPEYLLTESGRPIAAWCERAMEQRRRLGLEPDALGRWSLPLLLDLDRSWKRFSTLQAALRPITPRALSLALKGLIEAQLVVRRLEDQFPPLPLYGLSGRGRSLARPLLPAG